MALDDRYRRLPFEEAIADLEGKILLDSETWRDIEGDEHDSFFVVTGAKSSLLSELWEAVTRAIAAGLRPDVFQREFERIAEGWDHRGDKAWRARIIYDTNLRASYGRGREQYQLDPEVVRLLPYLRFEHSDSERPRPLHLALDQQIFRATEVPFSLPNGYGCACRYVSLSQRDLDSLGLSPSTLKRGDTVSVQMDGQQYNPVLEPAPGWDRRPALNSSSRRQEILDRVLDRQPPEIAAQVRRAIATYLEANPTAAGGTDGQPEN